MIAKFQKVTNDTICSYEYKDHSLTDFDSHYHFHPELEIILIVKGKGEKLIGETVSSYYNDTLLVLGDNLPHCFKSDVHDDNPENNHIIQLYLSSDFLGKDFFNIPEMRNIKTFLNSAKKGIEVFGETKKIIKHKLKTIIDHKDSFNMIEYLSILNILSTSNEVKNICHSGYVHFDKSDECQDKLNKVYKYIHENFNKDISLDYASSLVYLSKSGFCHFFLKRTGKNFSKVINEMRIEYACRKLMETDMSVIEICYECGYTSLSNFYKQFKQLKIISPLKYKIQVKKMLKVSPVEVEEYA